VSRVSRAGHGCPARSALTMENSGREKPRKVVVESRNCVEAAPSGSTRPRGTAELCARADRHGTGERGETGAGNDGACQLVIGAGARFAAGRAASAMSGTCCARDCSKAATPVQNCCHADAHYSTPVTNTVTSAVTTSTVSVETTPMTYGDTKEIKRPISGNYLQSIRANYPVTGPQGTGCCGEGNNIEAPLKGQFTNDTVGGGIFNEASRVDDRSRLEQLLVMSGIERHPGPEMGYRPEPMTTLTHDACVWVFDTAVWTAKTDKFADRVRAVLKHFMPGSMPHRRIARLATEASALTGEGMTEALRWQEFQSMVRQLLPHNALSEQDYLARMSRRAKEPWLDFMDRYSLYADTCKKVTEAIKAAELFRKLPRELRLQLTHVKHDATLTELMEAVRGVRYWQNCAQDKSIQFNPMELDSHAHRAHSSEDFDALVDVPAEDLGFRQGDSRGFGRGGGGSAGRFQRPVLRGDTINFRNIDGPRSLMTAWKKLVSTSPSFRREASEFLSRTKQRKSLHDQEVEFGEDFGRIQADFVDGEEDFWEDSFYDCEVTPEEECHQALALPAACRAAQKKSLHVKVCVEGVDVLALVDTGATSCFVQQALVKRLGLWDSVQPCDQEVCYGNGDTEPMVGVITLPVHVHGVPMPMPAYVLKSKGPSLIMGFTFLEANGLLVDCTSRELTTKDGGRPVKCLPVQTASADPPVPSAGVSPPACHPTQSQPEALIVQRFPVAGCLPPYPAKKFSGDAAYDFFAPADIHLQPGERLTVDTGIACHFPRDTWCLLREKSGLAHRYGVQLLGGVVDGNYRGRIKAIVVNTGSAAITIPRHTAFCQGILLPCLSHRVVRGIVRVEGERGASGGVNRVVLGNGGRRGLAAAGGRG